ncbi:HAMP domain-containing protein [Methylobrevis pamukkalensis]|uniref:HAMP domain protein n=1 Tax=Methylobrevis pamukkalensis TaxID=1439726 RepID=A0A1E3GXL0_9HYPH|nr:HAMP domain-containing protein [Methylobrevis pamukkalensis]ODN68763.1 HAMP domain protein [Methylobrevis pamukkalensis]
MGLSIKVKMPVVIVGLALVSAAAMGFIGWQGARGALAEAAVERLSLAADGRKDLMEAVARRVRLDLVNIAETSLVGSSIRDLDANLELNPAEFEKNKAYFSGAAEEVAAKDGADSGTMYGFRHAKIHALVAEARKRGGYADILLLSPEGRVIYSVAKGADFALRQGDPDLAGTALARLYTTMNADPAQPAVEDFAAYAPGGDRPSAFVGQAISRRSNAAMNAAQKVELAGFVVLRLDPVTFNAVLSDRRNLGSTGETVAIGPDGLLRSDAPGGEANAGDPISGLGLDALPPVGEAVSFARAGVPYMAIASQADVLGKQWTLVAAQSVDEAFAAVGAMTRTMLITAGVLLVLTVLAGLLAARSVTRPLAGLTGTLQAMAAGRTDVSISGVERRDEIGAIARAVGAIREMSAEEARRRVDTDARSAAAARRSAGR